MALRRGHLDVLIYIAFIAAIIVAPLLLDDFWVNRLSKYLVYGMLGVAISLSWGYAGILNLGQGLFFGAGAYMLAMSLKLASPTSLQSSNMPVPDFMLWNSEPGAATRLCCHRATVWMPIVGIPEHAIIGRKMYRLVFQPGHRGNHDCCFVRRHGTRPKTGAETTVDRGRERPLGRHGRSFAEHPAAPGLRAAVAGGADRSQRLTAWPRPPGRCANVR
jgi:hypothetical protein